jgi:glycosidase
MSDADGDPAVDRAATDDLLAWHDDVLAAHDGRFEASKVLSNRLGAHYDPDTGLTTVGFWTPELLDRDVDPDDVRLEVLTATEAVDLSGGVESVPFRRERVPLRRNGEFHWAVVSGMRPGTSDRLGALYRLVYEADGEVGTVQDPLGYSYPFGAFAPAELYDVERLDADRADRDYFEALGTDAERTATTDHDGLPRVDPATSMLEVHPGTATESGSLAGLARRYRDVADKLRAGEELTPAERNFVGYDAIQVMPVEPITENRERHDFWNEPATDAGTDGGREVAATDADADADVIEVDCGRPELVNWGYDIVVSGFSAPNPAILETGRPDELVEFIAACHELPRPIKVVFDVALGHADDRGEELLNDYYFEGPGMYGKHLDYRQPVVRAILLEMQRRKMAFGADGIRVDGAQDFTYWDAEREENVHDDAFLAEMDEVTQTVAGTEYRPWMVYEDGRPWPREDWELASTYRALIEQHPHSFQWSPITFAHNTPALLTFWATKWWRVREVADFGGNWLTGVANHDTIRRGTQVDPTVQFNQSPVNPYLGGTLQDTLDAAYNNPASSMLFYCALPGVPMDFTHANFRAPWGFVRDTDPTWNVKVVSEESDFLTWQVRTETFDASGNFPRIKALGFDSREQVAEFMTILSAAVDATDDDREAVAAMVSAADTALGDVTPADLDDYAHAWMRDVHELANLANWHDDQDDDRTAFDLAVREFRHERPWLRADVDDDREAFGYRHPTDGTVLYYALRESPDGDEQVCFAANMEGVPIDVSPATVAEATDDDVDVGDGWTVALTAPGVGRSYDGETFTLENGQAVVWTREP